MNCKICQSTSAPFGNAKVLKKYLVRYFQCSNCGFIQTEDPYWLEEAYSEPISKADIGLLGRNLGLAVQAQKFLSTCFKPDDIFIDYGGGYGIFVRLMRDKGFDFYRYDPFCKNLFAEGFDVVPNTNYAALTAWEVFEHLPDPLSEIEKMLSFSGNLFFSTILLHKTPKPLDQWWYYSLDFGQHISFFTPEALNIIAQKFNLKMHYTNGELHFMGDTGMNPFLIKIAFDHRLMWLQKILSKPKQPSLLDKDFHIVTGKYLK